MNTYYFISRPPMIGTHPDGALQIEAWYPSQKMDIPEGHQIHAFGQVDYPDRLPFKQIWKYDLLPVDPAERICYGFWADNNQDNVAARQFLEIYWYHPRLAEFRDQDPEARTVFWLKENGHTLETLLHLFQEPVNNQ